MITLEEILRLPVLQGAEVVAGRQGLVAPVRWCHVAEVLDIARLLSGGELLLTTGLGLDVPAARQVTYVEELWQTGIAGIMLELERKFHAAPPAMVEAAERVGLPLITLPFDTPFVKVTEAVHGLLLARAVPSAAAAPRSDRRLLEDLFSGLIGDARECRHRLRETGRQVPDPCGFAVLVADGRVRTEALREAAQRELGSRNWLVGEGDGERHLVAFAGDLRLLARQLRAVAQSLAPAAAGVSRVRMQPQEAAQALTEARQVMGLRSRAPGVDPLFAETGVYRLAFGPSRDEVQKFVSEWLEPLLQYDRAHRTDLCQTLRVLLDERQGMAEAAQRLHLTRQGLYHRQERIAAVLGRDLEEPETRLALAVALRFADVAALYEAAPPKRPGPFPR